MNNEHCCRCGVSYDSDYQSCNCDESPLRHTMAGKCLVCGAITECVATYDSWLCSACGQAYEYNEGHAILLTEPQLELLRTILSTAIPPGVYYSVGNDNFYTRRHHRGMGNGFYREWWGRRSEFPTA